MPNVSKYRATKPRIDGADVHVRVGSKGRSYPLGSPCPPGWRRSADRACLYANSLLTGNFYREFCDFRAQRAHLLARNGCAAETF
jgi:hypothetical protein